MSIYLRYLQYDLVSPKQYYLPSSEHKSLRNLLIGNIMALMLTLMFTAAKPSVYWARYNLESITHIWVNYSTQMMMSSTSQHTPHSFS